MEEYSFWYLLLAPCSACFICPCGPPEQPGDYDGQIVVLTCY